MPEATTSHQHVQQAAEYLRSQIPNSLESPVGVVLGSGLGGLVDQLENIQSVPYADVPHMPNPSVTGHAGQWVFGVANNTTKNTPVLAMKGRVHLYEGHPVESVVFGVRVLAELGAKALVLTNAAGGINPDFNAGDLMLIEDHLNLTGHNCLAGQSAKPFGPHFVDMTHAYNVTLQKLAKSVAKNQSCDLKRGVYAGLLGPNYETPAEVRMLHTLGASAVGMSTVLETLAARQQDLPVLGVSCITNMAAGISPTKLSHNEVKDTADRIAHTFTTLLMDILQKIPETLS